jgi:hypothetical protein
MFRLMIDVMTIVISYNNIQISVLVEKKAISVYHFYNRGKGGVHPVASPPTS